jgi:hypothetical protein
VQLNIKPKKACLPAARANKLFWAQVFIMPSYLEINLQIKGGETFAEEMRAKTPSLLQQKLKERGMSYDSLSS